MGRGAWREGVTPHEPARSARRMSGARWRSVEVGGATNSRPRDAPWPRPFGRLRAGEARWRCPRRSTARRSAARFPPAPSAASRRAAGQQGGRVDEDAQLLAAPRRPEQRRPHEPAVRTRARSAVVDELHQGAVPEPLSKVSVGSAASSRPVGPAVACPRRGRTPSRTARARTTRIGKMPSPREGGSLPRACRRVDPASGRSRRIGCSGEGHRNDAASGDARRSDGRRRRGPP